MKITIDTKTAEVKAGGKPFKELDEVKRNVAESFIRKFLRDNTPLTDYETDSMWMSYRYCIGRHTIASHARAGDIWANCKGRMTRDRSIFNAYDINKEIEDQLRFKYPGFRFPIGCQNRIYTSAIDIVCEFIQDYNIKSIDDFIKYKDIEVILTDNERGYKLEVTTWEEWLRPQVTEIMREYYNNEVLPEDKAWELFVKWKNSRASEQDDDLYDKLYPLVKDIPNRETYWMHDLEDLFVWNDLVHLLDLEHYHKSILIDGTECEWVWTWTENSERHDDGYYYKAFGYKKIRIPVDSWNGIVRTWIPDSAIEKDLY